MAHAFRIIGRISKVTALTVMGVVLFVAGSLMSVYSSWFQDGLRRGIVDMMNRDADTHFELAELRLCLPLRLEAGGLLWTVGDDTLVAAQSLDVRVRPLPLLFAKIDVEDARLTSAMYTMGNRDSATMIKLHADTVTLSPASVKLSPMSIHVSNGSLRGAVVDLYINPNPPRSGDKDTQDEPTQLDINIDDLLIRNLTYRMNMMPTIDSLGVKIGDAHLRGTGINLKKQTIKVGSLTGSRLNASYIVPDSAAIARTVVAPPDTSRSEPWTVSVGQIKFDRSQALYTTRGYIPQPGMDFGYIAVSDLWLAVNGFFNRAQTVRLPLALHGTERCGLTLSAEGVLDISADDMHFRNFAMRTPGGTSLKADGMMGMGDLLNDPSVPVRLEASGKVRPSDLAVMFPAFDMYLSPLAGSVVNVDADIDGTVASLDINKINVGAEGIVTLMAAGHLAGITTPDVMSGDLHLGGTISDVRPWTEKLLAGSGLTVPAMTIDGDVDIDRGRYQGSVSATTSDGDIVLDGMFDGRLSDYALDLEARDFPVSAFMPDLGIGRVTARLQGTGHGFAPGLPETRADIAADISHITYNGVAYSDIRGNVKFGDGHGDLHLTSGNPGLRFAVNAEAELSPGRYDITGGIDVADIDLKKMKLSPKAANISARADIQAAFNSSLTDVAAKLDLHRFAYAHTEGTMTVTDVTARLNATDSVTNVSVRNNDLYAFFSSPNGLQALGRDFGSVMPLAEKLMAEHSISVTALQQALPQFNLDIEAGPKNAVTQILADSDMSFGRMKLYAYNDSVVGLEGTISAFRTGTTRIDTITLDVDQHGDRLDYAVRVNNRPGTFDTRAHVDVDGYFSTNRLGIALRQQNIKGVSGFDIGACLTFGDSTATLKIDKLDPVIGYRQWKVNDDNFVKYNFAHKQVDANLHMSGNGSVLELYTENALSNDSTMHTDDEDLVVNISDIHLQDWISINPFMPAVKGDLSANLRLNAHENSLSGNGLVSVADLIYGKERIGDLRTTLNVMTNRSGFIDADVALWVNDAKAMTLRGFLNDTTRTDPLDLDLEMIHFPLSTANAFLPGIARLSGDLDGSLQVRGTADKPVLNGYLAFDSTAISVNMAGTTLRPGNERIPVRDNVVTFDNFNIFAVNRNPLSVNGTVTLNGLTDADIDLRLAGNNIQLVNTNRARGGAVVYGKAFADLDANVRGNLRFLNVKAAVDVLPGTNLTYIMLDAESTIREQTGGSMVKFINFADTAAVAAADSILPPEGILLNLAATLNVQSGSTINVDLNPGGSDKVQLKGQGSLNYSMAPIGEGRMTGRLNIESGFVRYTPPLMSEKKFDFSEGSYVAFTGELLNPTLNIHAVDRVRANVTQTGQNSRLIYFDVGLAVTGTLNNMDVAFDLSTDDDVTVANELATMSPTQRASSAMNLLITNMYSSGDTKASANLSGNALYSFLTSQLNSWAANTIKGVDLSFGISQYDNTREGATTQATSYSYRVSKSLFNDRFKIVVGGNYSTDADADENLAQNLVNDISFEYLINRQGTMLVRIFRHTGYESILEGEITQTGVGFVYKRKINRLADMFMPFATRRKNTDGKPETENNQDETKSDTHK